MVDPVPVTKCNFVSSTAGRRSGREGKASECGVYICFRMFVLKI